MTPTIEIPNVWIEGRTVESEGMGEESEDRIDYRLRRTGEGDK